MIALAEALERGALDGRWAKLLAGAWERTLGRSVTRPLHWPHRVRVVAVGGATLGGSGKTPLAIACAVELAAAGARTVFVGHAYRASPRCARVVTADDPLAQVGDEALIAAKSLAPSGVRVVVAPTRAEALAFAARDADVVVLDGVAQASPVRVSLALLAVDGVEPWGHAAALPPRGDLRASRDTLLEACDAVVALGSEWREHDLAAPGAGALRWSRLGRADRTVWPALVVSRGAWDDTGALLTWEALRRVRIGLLTALARPARVERELARHGIRPQVILRGRDHGPLPIPTVWSPTPGSPTPWRNSAGDHGAGANRAQKRHDEVDLWLATPKCVLHVRDARGADGANTPERGRLRAPVATLDHSVVLSPRLCARLRTLALP